MSNINLLEDDISTSESEKDDADDNDEQLQNPLVGRTLPNPLSTHLPSPALAESIHSAQSSVWSNPFLIEEQKQDSILQQHVKMTEFVPELTSRQKSEARRNQMTYCLNFQKGRCRYGNKCKYSHNLKQVEAMRASIAASSARRKTAHSKSSNTNNDAEEQLWEGGGIVQQERKRVGITGTVEPAKKALKTLTTERARDRPWTVNS